jgi:hypothetical protein
MLFPDSVLFFTTSFKSTIIKDDFSFEKKKRKNMIESCDAHKISMTTKWETHQKKQQENECEYSLIRLSHPLFSGFVSSGIVLPPDQERRVSRSLT